MKQTVAILASSALNDKVTLQKYKDVIQKKLAQFEVDEIVITIGDIKNGLIIEYIKNLGYEVKVEAQYKIFIGKAIGKSNKNIIDKNNIIIFLRENKGIDEFIEYALEYKGVSNVIVINVQNISKTTITAKTISEYKEQFINILNEFEQQNIVYTFQTIKPISRFKGKSCILYIGKTEQTLYKRYIGKIDLEINEYWDRYEFAIKEYGGIYIEIMTNDNLTVYENEKLKNYHSLHHELPPINLKSFTR